MDYARRSRAVRAYNIDAVLSDAIRFALIGPLIYYLEPHLTFQNRLIFVLVSLPYFSALSNSTSRLKAAIPPSIIFWLAPNSRATLLALGFKWLETRLLPAVLLYLSGDTSDEEAIKAILHSVIPFACYCISIACAACIPTRPALLALIISCFQYRNTLYSYVRDSFITQSLILPVFLRLWSHTQQCIILLHRHVAKFHDYLTAKLNRNIEQRQQYTYEPLAAGHIRLVRVLRRSLLSELRCELIHVPLSSAPDYEAISYCWGRDPPSKTILMNGQKLAVLPSVYDVLHYRRSFQTDRLLWIDFICINQEKREEKQVQIPLMRQIFSQATRVLAWLGDMEGSLVARYAVYKLIPDLCGSSLESIFQQDILSTKISIIEWSCLAKLFCKPWFNRIWIVQEVAFAKSVHMLFGRVCMDWDTLAQAIPVIFHPNIIGSFITPDVPGLMPFMNWSNAIKMALFRDQVKTGKLDSLTSIITQSSPFEASLDHDKIYALLGLADESGSRILPDYSKPAQEVYTDVMRLLLQMDDPLSALAMAGIGMKRNPKLNDLPSWVPDWSTPIPRMNNHSPWLPKRSDGDLHYGDGAGARYTARISVPMGNHRLVQTGGNIVDEIIAVSQRSPHSLDSKIALDVAGVVSLFEGQREWIVDAEKLAWTYSEDPYPSRCTHQCIVQQECLGDAFWRTLTRGRTLGVEAPSRSIRDDFLAFKWFLGLSDDSPSPPPYEQIRLPENEIDMGVDDAKERFSAAQKFIYGSSVSAIGRIAVTKKKYLAFVPPETQIGDVVVIVLGAETPYILRRNEAKLANEMTWQLVGPAYVHGCMDEDGLPENIEMLNLV
jgi:Heterokaryon incompatibility protein (HET)